MCEICGGIFRHLTKLIRHKKNSHASQHGERTCVECGKAFRDTYAPNRHLRCHSIQPVCPICPQLFPNRAALHKHKLLQRDKVPMDKLAKHECVICGRWFDDTHMLKRHSVVHTKQRPFVCLLCAKAYSQCSIDEAHGHYKAYRTYHKCEQFHSRYLDVYNIWRFVKCTRLKKNIVKENFSWVSVLKCFQIVELLQHDKVPMEKVAKHECAVCKRWFEDTCKLKRHSVFHTKQRPFVCVLCARAYSQNEAFRHHH
ncbi:zinc finger protein 2, partial [Clonorchis sinensis]